MKYNPNPQMPKVERLANPKYKEEYEMPAEYQEQVNALVKLIESRDEYLKILPTLPPDVYREAKSLFDTLDASVSDLEENLAFEYERFQEEQRRDQELYEMTWLQDLMSEELFIKVKHQRPHIFEDFVEYATKGMTDAEREEQYRIIALREQNELKDILSDKITAPDYENLYVKHRLPDEWIPELLFDIVNATFLTDYFFGTHLEALNRLDFTRRDYWFDVQYALPVRRRNMEEAIFDMKKQLGEGTRFLLEYTEDAIKSGKFTPLKHGYTKHLDDHLKYLENLVFYKYVIIKHTMPERLEEYEGIVTEGFSPAERESFFQLAAEFVEKKSKSLLESLEMERIAAERVETRRAAPDYKKIEGPQLPDAAKREMAKRQAQKRKEVDEQLDGKIEHDIPEIFKRYLKIFYAVTDGGGYAPVRYEDDESRAQEKIDEDLESIKTNNDLLYIIIKHQKPHLFEEFHGIVTEGMIPEELEIFQNRIAHLEATRLEEILKE